MPFEIRELEGVLRIDITLREGPLTIHSDAGHEKADRYRVVPGFESTFRGPEVAPDGVDAAGSSTAARDVWWLVWIFLGLLLLCSRAHARQERTSPDQFF